MKIVILCLSILALSTALSSEEITDEARRQCANEIIRMLARETPKEKTNEKHTRYVNEVTKLLAREMRKEYGLHCEANGKSMALPLDLIGVRFVTTQPMTLEEARFIEITAIKKFLTIINGHKKIRPFLAKYPFTSDKLMISILCKKNGKDCHGNSIDIHHKYTNNLKNQEFCKAISQNSHEEQANIPIKQNANEKENLEITSTTLQTDSSNNLCVNNTQLMTSIVMKDGWVEVNETPFSDHNSLKALNSAALGHYPFDAFYTDGSIARVVSKGEKIYYETAEVSDAMSVGSSDVRDPDHIVHYPSEKISVAKLIPFHEESFEESLKIVNLQQGNQLQ